MNRFALASLACFASVLLAGRAHAADANDDVPPKDPAAIKTTHEWYGWGTLATDFVSYTLMIQGAKSGVEPMGVVGVMGYVAGAPIVHAAEGESGRAVGSLILRLALPAIGAGLGAATYHKPSNPDALDFGPALPALAFAFLGGLTASVVDAAFIAHHQVPVDASDAPKPKPTSKNKSKALSFVPSVGVMPRGGVSAGVGGTF